MEHNTDSLCWLLDVQWKLELQVLQLRKIYLVKRNQFYEKAMPIILIKYIYLIVIFCSQVCQAWYLASTVADA